MPLLVRSATTSLSSAVYATSSVTVLADWVKLPQRPAGDSRTKFGAKVSTHTSSGRLLPTSALFAAEVRLTVSSVAANSEPSAFSLLSGSVAPEKRATKARPAGQLSAGTAAAVAAVAS